MAPGVDLTTWATPGLPLAACAVVGNLMVLLLPRVQVGAESFRNSEKFCVVPEESERTARVIAVPGRFALGLSALICGAFHVLTVPWKMAAMVAESSFRSLTPGRLYAMAIGPIWTGKYRTVLPAYCDMLAAGMGESEPANRTVPAARSDWPLPEPPPP